jgi:hypothetical protein
MRRIPAINVVWSRLNWCELTWDKCSARQVAADRPACPHDWSPSGSACAATARHEVAAVSRLVMPRVELIGSQTLSAKCIRQARPYAVHTPTPVSS